jgi:transposase
VVRLAESIGGNQAAKRLGIPDSSMRNWVRLSRAGKLKVAKGTRGQVKPGVRDLESENERLRLALANVKLDLEIVKMAVWVQWVIATRRLVLARAYESRVSFSVECLNA